MLQMFLTILTADWVRPACPVPTTSLVCCKCNIQHRWLDIAIANMNAGVNVCVSDMHACRHKFTDMTVG